MQAVNYHSLWSFVCHLQGREKTQLPSRKGKEIGLSSNWLYFTQTRKKFPSRCKSPLHTLLNQGHSKKSPLLQELGSPSLSGVAPRLQHSSSPVQLGKVKRAPRVFAISQPHHKKRRGKRAFSRGFYNKLRRVKDQRGPSKLFLRASMLGMNDRNEHSRKPSLTHPREIHWLGCSWAKEGSQPLSLSAARGAARLSRPGETSPVTQATPKASDTSAS